MSKPILENMLNEIECLSIDERLLLIEHLVESIRQTQRQVVHVTPDDIEGAWGILQASHYVSLVQMDEAIKQRGGQL